jgi:hypothetical protein
MGGYESATKPVPGTGNVKLRLVTAPRKVGAWHKVHLSAGHHPDAFYWDPNSCVHTEIGKSGGKLVL